MTRDYRVVCLSEAIGPITQMQSTSGNVGLIGREKVVTPRGEVQVPCLTGNAIRHRAVREPGARWLIGEYGLAGRLDLPQLHFLFNGGTLTRKGGREDTRQIAEMQRLWPLYRLLGGALPGQIVAGSCHVHRGTLVCEENRAALAHAIGDLLPAGRLRPAEAFVSEYVYTRSDARRTAADLAPPADAGEADSHLMIFSGQAVIAGAAFVHGFLLPHGSERELGALLWSLRLWRAAGGTIGGQAARGHGRLSTAILAGDWDGEAAVAAYLDHARSARDEAVAWLESAFAAGARPTAEDGPAPAEGGGGGATPGRARKPPKAAPRPRKGGPPA